MDLFKTSFGAFINTRHYRILLKPFSFFITVIKCDGIDESMPAEDFEDDHDDDHKAIPHCLDD